MAGQSKSLKNGEFLFKMGDLPDSMYIVRKGSLKVIIPKPDEELVLAELKAGSIVGEMAFFDDKPRSASVKSFGESEVTAISKADFEKLLQQIPKWLVSMMQSLVARLRSTNERVKQLESSHEQIEQKILPRQTRPYQHVLRLIQILLLSHAKDGEREGKDLILSRETPLRLWNDLFSEEQELFDKIVDTLVRGKLLSNRLDSRRVVVLVFLNRGMLNLFADFLSQITKILSSERSFFSTASMAIIAAITDTIESSGYDSLSISFKRLCVEASERGRDASNWTIALAEALTIPGIRGIASGDDFLFKVTIKEHAQVIFMLKILKMFFDSKLA